MNARRRARECHTCELALLGHCLQQIRAVGAELLARHRHDAPHDFFQFERRGERLQHAREKFVARLRELRGFVALRWLEIAREELAHGRVVAAVSFRQTQNARHRLPRLDDLAHSLPRRVVADGHETERLRINQRQRLFLGRRDHWIKSE